jgi:uncharacterized membrane protein
MFNLLRKKPKEHAISYVVLLCASVLALLASFQLSIDKQHIAEHPEVGLSCSINAILNCASVMKTPQASLLGFPNSWLGLMGFSVLLFVAIAGLMGTHFSRNTWRFLTIGVISALCFAFWLFFDSVYVIQILCPWCLAMTTSTVIIASAVIHVILVDDVLFNTNQKIRKQLENQYGILVTALILCIGILLVYSKFGNALFN